MYESDGFALVFEEFERCKKVFDFFESMKQTNGMTISNFGPTYKKFLNLFLNGIQKNVPEVEDLRRIANTLPLSEEEKNKFKVITLILNDTSQVIPESLEQSILIERKSDDIVFVDEDIASIIKPEPNATPTFTTPVVVDKPAPVYVTIDSDDEEKEETQNRIQPFNYNRANSSLSELNNSPMERENGTNHQKRKIHSDLLNISDSASYDEVFTITPKSKKPKQQPTPNKSYRATKSNGEVVQSDMFELVLVESRRKIVKKLILFCSPDKKSLCYVYSPLQSYNKYFCYPCRSQKNIHVNLKLYQNGSNGDFIQLNETKHECIPQKYDPDIFVKIQSSPENLENLNEKSLNEGTPASNRSLNFDNQDNYGTHEQKF